ncbi:MAG: phosphoribosylanthranilate isomerase [Verrucomicrobiae bacterium]|nr:phosphoribosylanthranilate isomerase [Verrucomicrobiae bacterium]
MVRVKICGITRLEDAVCAVEAGAAAIGFVFFQKSRRWISPSAAAAIASSLPPFVVKVGVFVNESAASILETTSQCRLDALQLHGDESPGFCATLPATIIKAFRVKSPADLARLRDYPVSACLLDSFHEREYGGTGQPFDWNLALQAKNCGKPIILSGGLHPGNVAEAIQQVQPYAVDVSSGVEDLPGIKNHAKIRAFMGACR